MKRKVVISKNEFSIDGQEIGNTVSTWQYGVSMNHQGQHVMRLTVARFVYEGDKPMMDDSGACVFGMVFDNPDITISLDGEPERSKIIVPNQKKPGLKLL